MKVNTPWRGCLLSVCAAMLTACGSGGSQAPASSGLPNSGTADVISPTISIALPAATGSFSSTASTVAISGTAADNVGVQTVTWSNSRGGSGTASGTTAWTISAVALLSGANVITVTVVDAAGNRAQAMLTVTYTPPTGAVVTVDSSVQYQTIHGWEASAQAGQDPKDGTVAQPYRFTEYSNALFDMAVNELGISRLRVHVRSGVENPVDNWALYENGTIDVTQFRQLRYQIVNDDAVPTTVTASGFHFSELDDVVNKVVLPLKQRVEARGEKLFINVCYTSFHGNAGITTSLHASNAAEYGEFVLATVQHLQATFGWVPDAWEVMLEPDHLTASPVWNGTTNGVFLDNGGTLVGNAIVAAGARLQAAGFGNIKFIAPSTTDMSRAVPYFNQMLAVPGVAPLLYELSYHRYKGVSNTVLQSIATTARANNIGTAMLEHDGSGQGALPADDELRSDLTTGMNSAWQQFTLAFPNSGGLTGRGVYIAINSPLPPAATSVQLTDSAKLLRQYFYFVRPGAVRVSATSTDLTLQPLAFTNANGKRVVAVKTNGAATFSITGLPAGVYGINYTTTTQYNVNATDVTLTAGQALPVSMPGNGVITIYGR